MITTINELEIAFENLQRVQTALRGLAQEMQVTNPHLFPVVSQTYTRRICLLQDEIRAYFRENPAETAAMQSKFDTMLARQPYGAEAANDSYAADGANCRANQASISPTSKHSAA